MTPPPERIGQALRDARRAGAAFDEAWPRAVDAALDGLRGDEREGWAVAFDATRHAWEGAWQGRPATRAQRALSVVATDPDRQPLAEVLAGCCPMCRTPIASTDRRAVYCGPRCRRNAHVARQAA